MTQNKMRIVSKIECISALANLDEILEKSDAVLIDRGDLSKEIPLERIPFTQKIIMHKARRHGTEVYVATNLLETMIDERKPTRAEVQDVVNTILDGAAGLTLAAETAVGAYPIQCINMLNKLIWHTEQMRGANGSQSTTVADGLIQNLEANNYLVNHHESSALVPPHGGQLVNRTMADPPNTQDLGDIPKICLDVDRQMDVEQIAFGTYSPLEGFVGQEDLQTILEDMRLGQRNRLADPHFFGCSSCHRRSHFARRSGWFNRPAWKCHGDLARERGLRSPTRRKSLPKCTARHAMNIPVWR